MMNSTATHEATSDATAPHLLDVRSRGEFASGHIDGATNLPLDELVARIGEVAPDKSAPLLLCCASGMRSRMAAALLAQLGYGRVQDGGGVGGLAMSLGRAIRRA